MPTIGEEFVCGQELANENDAHAVAMYEDEDEVLGHIPWEFSRVAFQFLEHGGSITSRDTGRRRYCCERGGMEIPCQLTFTGKRKHITTLKRFLDSHWFSYIDH